MQTQNKTPIIPAAGPSNFREYIEQGYYYVDKTEFIRPAFLGTNPQLLILRPRRFGKSLFQSTLKYFLGMNYKNPDDVSLQQRLFKGLKVSADREFCEQNMGRHPVVSLSLKKVDETSFDKAYAALCSVVRTLYRDFRWLLDSDRIDCYDKEEFRKGQNLDFLLTPVRGRQYVKDSLSFLCSLLADHTGRYPVVLIDEYDVPLQKAALGGYYTEMIKIIKGMFEDVVKDNAEVRKVVLTGCLKASKESIFTGMNNITVNSVLTQNNILAQAFGFTPAETRDLLSCFGRTEFYEKARQWYDGYSIDKQEIFCPWDVTSYTCAITKPGPDNPESIEPQPYWNNTSGNSIIREFLPDLSAEDADRMQELLDGKDVKLQVSESLIYKDLSKHLSEHFWSILVFTGYLTLAKRGSGEVHEFRIPNTEVRQCFNYNIQKYQDQKGQGKFGGTAKAVVTALLSGDSDSIAGPLNELLRGFVSVRDSATRAPKENFYQGFMNGLFAAAGDSLISEYSSNRESGDGYPDITFKSHDRKTGVVLELKAVPSGSDIDKAAALALEQIEQKDYAAALRRSEATKKIFGCGIAFRGRECAILMKEIA